MCKYELKMEITHNQFYFIVNCSHTAICNHIVKKPNLFYCQLKLTCTLTKSVILNLLSVTWAADPGGMIHQSGNSPFCEVERC